MYIIISLVISFVYCLISAGIAALCPDSFHPTLFWILLIIYTVAAGVVSARIFGFNGTVLLFMSPFTVIIPVGMLSVFVFGYGFNTEKIDMELLPWPFIKPWQFLPILVISYVVGLVIRWGTMNTGKSK